MNVCDVHTDTHIKRFTFWNDFCGCGVGKFEVSRAGPHTGNAAGFYPVV